MIKHHPSCTADYPEKIGAELPQQETEIRISGDAVVTQCVDCGAFETKSSPTVEKLGERIARRDRKIERLKRKIKWLENQLRVVREFQ